MKGFKLDGYTIFITEHVLNLLAAHKQRKRRSHESGGILLGQVKDKGIYIIKISTPSVMDKSSRTSFERDRDKAQIIIDHEFQNSGRRTIYLGEWHTHPEDYPKPSSVDDKMILSQLANNKLNEPFVLLLIQGRKGLFLGKAEKREILGISIREEDIAD